jgi:flagellum-specific peptidoglycan hydrolase FlgJ
MALGNRTASLAVVAVLAGCAGSNGEPRQTASANVATTTPAAPAASAPSATARASATSCFAPLPGHPTSAEKRAFIDEVSPLAVNAERQHGVPAAAVAAMAIQESGYGWTTLAQHTNDIMAWKYTTASAAGGRDSWVLDCGATKDRYIVFPDRAQAVDFVARQLATSGNYANATNRYRQERAQGAPAVEAIDRWVDDIADPYASQPEPYRAAIKRVMNNPLDPSDRRSPNDNLYRLSESVQTAGSGAPAR